jgi:triosephosphate isomerase (TIM)
MIIINFKNYSTNLKLIARAQLVEKYLPNAIIAVPLTDIFEVTAETKLKVFAEHIDWQEKGRATGFIIPEEVKNDGATGSLLNHSEHRLKFSTVKTTLARAAKAKLKIILCASSVKEVKKFAPLKPWAIAYEDPKLVASGKSITKYKTEEVKKFAQLLKKTKIIPICGAGIHSVADIKAAKKLGCHGVLIASAIAAASPKKAEDFLRELAKL